MGVNGFTPFLQKICPAVLKQYPNRLKALEGKRIVIDGTLITQRFHFMSHSHPNHHVLGWYRLAQELERNNISAVCVFDGKDRNAAKTEELKRRREARKLTLARGAIEDTRFQRLQDLKSGMDQLQNLDDTRKQEVVKILKDSEYRAGDTSAALLDEQIIRKQEYVQDSGYSEVTGDTAEPSKPDTLQPGISPMTNAAELANFLKSLHLSYKAKIAQLVSISPEVTPAEHATPSIDTNASKQHEEMIDRTMTKQQHQLTIQEGKLWNTLSVSMEDTHFEVPMDADKDVNMLLDKSHEMATSFQKRNNGPTAQTYRDSKAILKAMGIPCIDATGAIEAEALASSIVLEGLADYVASEDTDVLVYEAPMIRNITAGTEPLLVISGADVRTELDLTREAYVDFVLLLGTDFSQRIKNLGPVRAYEFIKKHSSIERVLQAIEDNPKYSLKVSPDAYMAQVEIARLVFGTLPSVPSAELMKPLEKDDGEVKRILQEYDLQHIVRDDIWYDTALAGNLFHDDPRAA